MESTSRNQRKEFDAETQRHVEGYYEAERIVQKYIRRLDQDIKEVLRAWRTDSIPDETYRAINRDTIGHVGRKLEELRPRALAYEKAQNKKKHNYGKEEHIQHNLNVGHQDRNRSTSSTWRSRVGMMNISNDFKKRRNNDGSNS